MKLTLLSGAAVAALLSAGMVHAQEVAPVAAAAATADVTEVVILGHGQSRQTQTINGSEIKSAAPGTSPLKVLNQLPGVNFQSTDPFGAYEWSTYMTIRGFNQNQMGFTLDGITLGDMSYGNYNGLHISRAIINEDIGRVELAQGAGALETASSSNLGGTVRFVSRDPSRTLGGEVAGTLGSNAMHRVYGRFDTGAIDALGGLRGYVSAVDQKTDKWKGGGEQRQQQIDTRWVLPLGDNGQVSAFVNHSERREQDYQDMSFDMIKRLGRDFDNFQPDWQKAVGVAAVLNNPAYYVSGQLDPSSGYWTGNGVNPYAQYGVANPDDAYYAGAGVRNDTLSAVSWNQTFGIVSANATVYSHTDKGQGLWWSPYNPSPNYGVVGATTDNAPLSIRTTEYDIDRKGVIGGLNFNLGAHQVSLGGWMEDNDFNQARRYYAEDLAAPKRDPLGFQHNPYFTKWQYAFNTKTSNVYVQDVWTLSEALKINYGFKSLSVTNKVHTITGSSMEGEIKSSDSFLPQVGAVYALSRGNELFATYSENMDAYTSAATSGPFASQSQSVVDYIRDHLKPESSKTLEGGYRFRTSNFQGVAAVYHVNFKNRILAVQQGPAIQGNAPVLSNVGSVETNGLELAGTYRFNPALKLYVAYSYNDSKYKDNVVAADGTIKAATQDKTVVNSPKNMVKTELNFDNGSLFASLSANYLGKRYYTYTNNGGRVPSSTVTDLTAGYHFPNHLDVQVNVTNLFNVDYISTIGEAGFVNSDPSGSTMTVMPGAPQQVFVTVRKAF